MLERNAAEDWHEMVKKNNEDFVTVIDNYSKIYETLRVLKGEYDMMYTKFIEHCEYFMTVLNYISALRNEHPELKVPEGFPTMYLHYAVTKELLEGYKDIWNQEENVLKAKEEAKKIYEDTKEKILKELEEKRNQTTEKNDK